MTIAAPIDGVVGDPRFRLARPDATAAIKT
jgi:hypothetical protein